jgi:peptidoglycan/LPS O-acetylase OafA/YrhL
LAGFFDGGYYGVDLFFVISGYLITTILLKNPNRSFAEIYRTFVGRRALRIFPVYYALLLVLLVTDIKPAREMILSLASYTFNYAAALRARAGLENPLFYLWSLSVEEQFYLVWPLFVILLRWRTKSLFIFTFAIVLVGYAQLIFGIFPAFRPFDYTGLLNRMGSLGMGALGAIYSLWKPLPSALFRDIKVEIAALITLAAALGASSPVRFIFLGLVSLFLVLKAVHFEFLLTPLDRFLTSAGVVYIGAISYGIYLFHVPVGIALTPHLVDPIWNGIPFEAFGPLEKLRWHSWMLKLPLYSVVTITIASGSFRFFERPILKFKTRWFDYKSVKNLPESLGASH